MNTLHLCFVPWVEPCRDAQLIRELFLRFLRFDLHLVKLLRQLLVGRLQFQMLHAHLVQFHLHGLAELEHPDAGAVRKMGKQQNKWRSWSSLPWKIHMQGSNQKWRLSRQRWNCNVDFEHRTWRFDPNMGLSPANLMLLTNHPCRSTAGRCLKKKILGIKYQGTGREGGKTYRLRLTTTEDWRKIFYRRTRTCA